jgi:hypothetical protein
MNPGIPNWSFQALTIGHPGILMGLLRGRAVDQLFHCKLQNLHLFE